MIISKIDLDRRVLCEDDYKQKLKIYIETKKIWLEKRIEGIKD